MVELTKKFGNILPTLLRLLFQIESLSNLLLSDRLFCYFVELMKRKKEGKKDRKKEKKKERKKKERNKYKQKFNIQCKPLNVITLGQRESDSIIRMITISESPSCMKYLTESDLGLGRSGSI